MDKQQKRELAKAYTQAKTIGAIYCIRNTQNGKVLLSSTTELHGTKNRFNFTNTMKDCFHMKLRGDWKVMGNEVFVLEILEELEMKSEQTLQEFKADLKVLMEMWEEKFDAAMLY